MSIKIKNVKLSFNFINIYVGRYPYINDPMLFLVVKSTPNTCPRIRIRTLLEPFLTVFTSLLLEPLRRLTIYLRRFSLNCWNYLDVPRSTQIVLWLDETCARLTSSGRLLKKLYIRNDYFMLELDTLVLWRAKRYKLA